MLSRALGLQPPPCALQLLSQPAAASANEIDASHHMAVVMELDLTTCHPSSLADRINAMPALKTSAAFFTFLRANLAICPEMASNVSTPVIAPIVHVPPSANAASASPVAALDDIPPLSLNVLTARADKVDALRLVADSIAQQRQTASRSLVFHPLNLAGLALALGVAYQVSPSRDLGTALTLFSGITMTYLLAIRFWSAQYIQLAEGLSWDWLSAPASDDAEGPEPAQDTVIGARFGEEMIGALVLRLEGRKHGRGLIRAWTTKLRYRRRGIGSDLLGEAVQVTRERCGHDAVIGFAEDHANSQRVLPELYNGPFRAAERHATQALDKVLAELDGKRRRQ